ncbi:hypothetical protein Tco_0433339 [Tanacetum coccineum]
MHEDFEYVESFEKEIYELESEKADFSKIYDLLLKECVSKDVICSYLHSLSDLNAHTGLQCLYLHKVKECECLAQKLSKQTESVNKEVHNNFANHDECVLEYLSKLNPVLCIGIRMQNPIKTTKRIYAVEKDKGKSKDQKDRSRLELGIHDHSNEPSSSKLVPKVVPLAVKTATSRQELELLFHHHIEMPRTTVSIFEPKNIKEAMADSAWIEAIQEELHQFDSLKVWELVDKTLGQEDYKAKVEEVYVLQPEGFDDPEIQKNIPSPGKLCMGIKASPRAGMILSNFLISEGFTKGLQIHQSQKFLVINIKLEVKETKTAQQCSFSRGRVRGRYLNCASSNVDEDTTSREYGFNYTKYRLYCDYSGKP